ncbi:MAG: PilW family protein [Candidatus Methylomirabilales bacterium]
MTDRHKKSKGVRTEAGFTLAETLIATVISTIVLLGLYLLYDVNQATFIRGEAQSDLQQNARIAMDRIVRELRLAGRDPSGTLTGGPAIPGAQAKCGNPPPATPQAIETAEATCIRFYADVDSKVPLATERVEYSYDAANRRVLRRQWDGAGAGSGAQPLADRVTAFSFTFYGENDVPIAPVGVPPQVPQGSLGAIRGIRITITTQDTQMGSAAQPFTLRAEVRPRNLGL